MDEFDVLAYVVSGEPVPFEVGGSAFAFRQPSPVQMDKLRFAQTRAYDQVYAEYRADGLDKEPVTPGLTETRRVYNEALEAVYQQANADGDGAAARKAAEDMDFIASHWPRNLAEERARDHAKRYSARWVVDNLLIGDKDDFRRLTAPDPLNRAEVNDGVNRLFSVTNHDPNLNGRTQ